MSLRAKAESLNSGCPCMVGREKGVLESLADMTEKTVIDFGYMNDGEHDYLCFIIKEDDKNFYFGGSVITAKFQQFDEKDLEEVRKEGLPILFTLKKSKAKRDYTDCTFYPTF
jgi:hypothetical protein